jgi:hypothetical protein
MHRLERQNWKRDRADPCLSLGSPGAFDDTHIFAPCVAFEDGEFSMWYCGSQGTVETRVFGMGLATSTDGVHFTRHGRAPVLCFADGQRSILTPALLRHPDGSVCREDGRLHMWFAACNFPTGDGLHTLHASTSRDGRAWSTPSDPQFENVYAPTIMKEGGIYRMWYADVSTEPWCFRYAESGDGVQWKADVEAVLVIDQRWERNRLFYPTVLKAEGLYLMWYGSYTHAKGEALKTALGFAVSKDGRKWQKYAENPVFEPEPSHPWESHFTTSQAVLRLTDGSWRIWYASRQAPPFIHKYYAIGTARSHHSPSARDSNAADRPASPATERK